MNHPELDPLRTHFTALLGVLALEREALTAYDGAALDACVENKTKLCQTITQILHDNPELMIRLQTANETPDGNHVTSELDADHKSLLDLASTARDSNLVNGKILHRSQQSVREILGILSGKSLDGLYGQTGQQQAGPETGGNAIAHA